MSQLDELSELTLNPKMAEDYKKLKLKLCTAIKSSNGFCGVCFSVDKRLHSLADIVNIRYWEKKMCVTFSSIMETLFGEKDPSNFASSRICDTCSVSAVNAFVFIHNTKRTSEIMEDYIQQLNSRINEVQNSMKITPIYNSLLILKDPFTTDDSNLGDDGLDNFDDDQPSTKRKKSRSGPKYKCGICNKIFYNKDAIERHIKRHDKRKENKFTISSQKLCPECEEDECKHHRYLLAFREQRVKGTQGVSCPDCKFQCWVKSAMITHVNRYHLKTPSCICEFCAKPFYSRYAHKVHVEKFHGSLGVCEYCDTQIIESKLSKHKKKCKESPNPFKCDQCPASFSREFKLEDHIKKKHAQINIFEFPCNLCNRVFTSESSLGRHNRTVHGDEEEEPAKKPKYVCSICNAEFQFSKLKREHMRLLHKPNEKHRCLTCNLLFDTAAKYYNHTSTFRHLRKIDPNFRFKYKCDQCNFSAIAPDILEGHINAHHLKIAPFECQECGLKFTGIRMLRAHQKGVHEETKKYHCEVCGSVLRTAKSLRLHMRIHTGDKPYKCDICHECYLSSSRLKCHIARHHGEKNCKCPACGMSFHTTGQVRSHFKKVHFKVRKGQKFDSKRLKGASEAIRGLFIDKRRRVALI